jgi:glutamate/tyrosine decarboxylase-like PLP-dependent enzyme
VTGTDWPDDSWLRAVAALKHADSVTIDPHKLGFVPYPAGAFLLRDRRGRNLVSLDPPYLDPGDAPVGEGFLGRWILEGSKPGAAAAATWLSHRVIPLDVSGHGFLVHRTAAGARRLHAALTTPGALGAFGVVALPAPDLNVVGWVVTHPGLGTLDRINALNLAIQAQLGSRSASPPYWLTHTNLHPPGGRGVALPLVERLGCAAGEWEGSGLVMLRATVMDPFFVDAAPDHCGGLVAAVADAARAALPAVRV